MKDIKKDLTLEKVEYVFEYTPMFKNIPFGEEKIDKLVDNIMLDVITNIYPLCIYRNADFNVYRKTNRLIVEVGHEASFKGDFNILFHIENEIDRCYYERGISTVYNGGGVVIEERNTPLSNDCPMEEKKLFI